MKELSLHILDIMQNSVRAKASLIQLTIIEDIRNDLFEICIEDNGKGMSKEMVVSVTDPFVTCRTTRRVGLGIPLLKAAAELTGGGIELTSELGVGTVITARFGHSHIDRQPLGDIKSTLVETIASFEEIDFVYTHRVDDSEYVLDTREMRKILGGVSFNTPDVMAWLSEFIKENEEELYKTE